MTPAHRPGPVAPGWFDIPSDEVELPGALDGFLPGHDIELAVEGLRVALDRVDRQVERRPDLPRGRGAAERAQEGQLAVGQVLGDPSALPRRTSAAPDPGDHPCELVGHG